MKGEEGGRRWCEGRGRGDGRGGRGGGVKEEEGR